MKHATALLLLPLAAFSAPAFADDGLDAYLTAVSTAEADLEAACAALPAPPAGRVWLRLGPNGVEIAPADAAAAEAAAFWADAALGARTAAETLYGQATGAVLTGRPVMIETSGDGLTAVHDGGARSLGDACGALKRLTGAFGSAGAGGDAFAAARAAAAPAPEDGAPRMALALGGEASLALTEPPPAGALARGPDGIVAWLDYDRNGDATLFASATGDAEPGVGALRLYDPADPFRPVLEAELTILPGDAPAPVETGGEIAPGDVVDGVLPMGAEDTMLLRIETPGRVTVGSDAFADLTAQLTDSDGNVIASDDDSGDGYGFSLSADLRAGEYLLNLTHCCGGGGPFSVTVSAE